MRRTKLDTEKTIEVIYQAALDVFCDLGYDRSRLEDVARVAGMTRGAIYHHFQNKETLYRGLIQRVSDSVIPRIKAISVGGKTPYFQLVDYFMAPLTLLEENGDYRKLSTILILKTPHAIELSDGLAQKQNHTRDFISQIEQVFVRGVQEGYFKKNCPCDMAARGFVAMQSGLISTWLMDPSLMDLRVTAQILVDQYLSSYAVSVKDLY